MYEEYFRFSAAPFRLNPDPKFFFGSRSHNKAMAYLHYGLRQAEGFIVITGEIGAGKSILIGHLIDQLDRSNVVAAHLLTANLQPSALLSHILSAFRIEPAGTGKSAEIEAFEDFLFDQMNRGRRVLLIVDEAQNLPAKTIEELRMLSNMDYDGTPLFQVFLVGQPEFRDILAKSDMEQFRQRIIASYHLEPLGQEETTDYIRHRLSLVGWTTNPSLSDEAFKEIFRATGGVPRKINKLCNRILLYCSIEKLSAIDGAVVKAVETDLKSENLERARDETKTKHKAEKPAAAKQATAPAKANEADEPPKETVSEPEEERSRAAVGESPASLREAAVSDEGDGKKRSPVVIPFGAIRKIGERKPAAQKALKTAAGQSDAKEPVEAIEKSAAPPAEKAEKPAAETVAVQSGDAGGKADSESTATPEKIEGAVERLAEEAQSAPADSARQTGAPLSVFDRLRAQREAEEALAAREGGRAPATLMDVANAIAAVSAASRKSRDASKADEETVEETSAAIAAASKGWRQSVLKSINEARDELKTAHANIERLRRNLDGADKRRGERREKAKSRLSRAESLLKEIRDASY